MRYIRSPVQCIPQYGQVSRISAEPRTAMAAWCARGAGCGPAPLCATRRC